jgi:hypothetical protein
VLLRLGYLTVSNVFIVLRLLPMGDRDKDVEILALRHQIAVLGVPMTRSQMAFIRGVLGSVVMVRSPSALNTSPNAAVKSGSRS